MNKKILIIVGVIAAALVLAWSFMPNTAAAQYYYSPYNNSEQLRASLIAQVNQLLAQMRQLENQQTNQQVYYYTYNPNTYTPTYNYNPNGQVLGVSTSGNSAVDIETLDPTVITDDEARVFGEIDLNGVSYATVWFEYGESRNFGERTNSARIDRFDTNIFRVDLEDLDEDEKYYYRAVARDQFGRMAYGDTETFETRDDNGRRSRNNDDEPDVKTDRARNITDYSAELSGEVDMNDFNNGIVFFVYGEDEDQVEDISDDYDEYRDIDEDGDDLQKIRVDTDLDSDEEYERTIGGLDDDTEYFFSICVEFEDEDDDETIICGDVEDFETDRD